VTYTHILSVNKVSLDLTYLEGRDGDIVVKEQAVVDFQIIRVTSYVFKGRTEIPMFNARMNEAIDHGCNLNDCDVLYSKLETVIHRRHRLL
jgi:hypothetical protein